MPDAPPAKSLLHKSRRSFVLRKLHSLSGVIPVGAFLLFHLWTNAKALQGQDTFETAVAEIAHMPYLPVLEIGLILLPLAFHAGYGFRLMFESRPNVVAYPYSRNWMYTMQRLTGILALLFIGFHLSEYWLPKWRGLMTPEQFYPTLCANMSSTMGGLPITGLIYIVGIAASVFHFANGLWGFCFSWGITVSRRAQAAAAWVFGIVGVVIFLIGVDTVLYFGTGIKHFGLAEAGPRSCADLLASP